METHAFASVRRVRAPCWACSRCPGTPGRRSRAQPPHGVSGCASSRRFLSLPHGSPHRDHAHSDTCGHARNRLLASQVPSPKSERSASGAGVAALGLGTHAQSAVHLCDPAMPTQHAAARLTHPARHPAHPPTRYPRAPLIPRHLWARFPRTREYPHTTHHTTPSVCLLYVKSSMAHRRTHPPTERRCSARRNRTCLLCMDAFLCIRRLWRRGCIG